METYLNPVYNRTFPDPFVLKHRGEYWAYCTGMWKDGRCFGVLRSRDLVHWEEVGGAMERLAEPHPQYWAPEVTYSNGRFYLYYSVGDEATMHIRVAVSEHPAGPFVDSGRRLTREPFAIDAHVFVADDGAWHMFYAADFLDHTHIGTGTVRDRMLDPYTLAGDPTPVALPRYDWHVYDPHRAEKGGVRWHTIEGPFVLERKGRFYQMFSGGNWQNVSYGVSYALADAIDQPAEWEQVADGERVLPILRTVPGKVVGPGHNSVVRGPDNMQLFCVYHRWAKDGSGRVLAIDRQDWAGDRILVLGPSTDPQPAPNPPTIAAFFDEERDDGLGAEWACAGGRWLVRGGEAVQELGGGVALARRPAPANGVVEVSVRGLDAGAPGMYGLSFGNRFFALIAPGQRQLVVRTVSLDAGPSHARLPLPPDFDATAVHLLRVELNAGRALIALDGNARRWRTQIPADLTIDALALVTERAPAAFSGLAVTAGWQDLFAERGVHPAELGWQTEDRAAWRVDAGELWHQHEHASAIFKGLPLAAYELVVNARLVDRDDPADTYGFYPAGVAGASGPLVAIERSGEGWSLVCRDNAGAAELALPGFDPFVPQQFRFRKHVGRLAIQWEAHDLGEIAAPSEPTQIGLRARKAAFDMVRVAALA
jgi:GH43 family beta-xylosidase